MIFCTFNFEIILYKEKFIKIKKFNKQSLFTRWLEFYLTLFHIKLNFLKILSNIFIKIFFFLFLIFILQVFIYRFIFFIKNI